MKIPTQTDKLIDSVKRIHMIGIGGAGMCPLAEILQEKGYELTGSDNNESDTLARVRAMGIPVSMGHHAENIGNAELVVHSAAIMQDNAELAEARRRGIPTLDRSLLLGAMTRKYNEVIGVCGTHGKTTVTSMVTQILMEAGLDPSAIIGGKLPIISGNGRAGKSELMVCEACEYVDTFLQMSPDIAILLNVDDDHMEYFKTVDNLILSFHKFLSYATKAVIVNGDDPKAMRAAQGITVPVITFGLSDQNDYYACNIEILPGTRAEFDLMFHGQKLTRVHLNVPGRHNILNALAAFAAAILSGVDPEQAAKGLRNFGGAGRRFEILGHCGGITIADDYAHHPSELKVTLEAANGMGFKRVWAVFQPFTFSRTAMLMNDFVEVLKLADRVVLAQIMGSREKNTYGVHTSQLAEKVENAVWFETFEEIADYIVENAQSGDLVITLGCGDIYKAAKLMLKKYDAREINSTTTG